MGKRLKGYQGRDAGPSAGQAKALPWIAREADARAGRYLKNGYAAGLCCQETVIVQGCGMTFRIASQGDCARLAELNHQLIRDEGHRNPMTVLELEERMKGWLAGEYRAVIFEEHNEVVAYALFREEAKEIYLRQFFVVRARRRQGMGRRAVELLRSKVWPKDKRLTVEVLAGNEAGTAFWRSVGFKDYALTLEGN